MLNNLDYRVNQTNKTSASISTTNTSEALVVYLIEYLDSYDEIKKLISNLNIDISNMFLPNTLVAIDKAFSTNEKLCLQLLNFIDLVKFYSFLLFNDPNYFTNNICKIIVSNRVLVNEKSIYGKEVISSIFYSNDGGLEDLLESNTLLVSLYVFVLVSQIQES